MTFKDIFKSSFLENYSSITMFDMISTLLVAFILGLFIFYVYKRTYQGVMYSKSFGITLISLTMITSMLILAVTSNVVLSLGMVGALSIVRFRTAIKESSDIAFLFWSISIGIILAAGFLPLAIIGSGFIGLMLFLLNGKESFDGPYILVLKIDSDIEDLEIKEILKKYVKKISLKSKTINDGIKELNYEIRLKTEDTNFVNTLSEKEGVHTCILVSYNGDYMN